MHPSKLIYAHLLTAPQKSTPPIRFCTPSRPLIPSFRTPRLKPIPCNHKVCKVFSFVHSFMWMVPASSSWTECPLLLKHLQSQDTKTHNVFPSQSQIALQNKPIAFPTITLPKSTLDFHNPASKLITPNQFLHPKSTLPTIKI